MDEPAEADVAGETVGHRIFRAIISHHHQSPSSITIINHHHELPSIITIINHHHKSPSALQANPSGIELCSILNEIVYEDTDDPNLIRPCVRMTRLLNVSHAIKRTPKSLAVLVARGTDAWLLLCRHIV